MSFLTQKWQIYLGGKMSGLSFEEMNNWRQVAKEKLISAAQTSGYYVYIINPVDFYNFEKVEYQSDAEVMDY